MAEKYFEGANRESPPTSEKVLQLAIPSLSYASNFCFLSDEEFQSYAFKLHIIDIEPEPVTYLLMFSVLKKGHRS
jgi:hypothetical protein